MKHKSTIVPLATALAALATNAAVAQIPQDASPEPNTSPESDARARSADQKANVFLANGEELLGVMVTKGIDGEVIAQHVSHESHSSHVSHASHTSSS